MIERHANERELEQVLAGEAAAEVEQHVLVCSMCRQRIVELAREEAFLMQVLLRAVCPDSLELGEWVAGLLPAERAQDIRRHVDECPHCREEAALLREVLTFSSQEPVSSTVANKAKRLVARLLSSPSLPGTLPGEVLFALRGTPAGGWQYQAGTLLVTLDVERAAPADYTLFGLVVSDAEQIGRFEGTRVCLKEKGGAEVCSVQVDDLDTFVFASLSPGTYTLEIETEEGIVVIEDVKVGNAHAD